MGNVVSNNLSFPQVKPNLLDRCIAFFSPERGSQRLQTRMRMEIAAQFFGGSGGGYEAASTTRRETNTWNPYATDADTAVLNDLPKLRSRSRDAIRNQPLAAGAVGTTCTNVVGAGLTLQSMVDRDLLGMTEKEADDWQRHTERRFNLWAGSQDCTLERNLNFNGALDLILRQRLANGESFVNLPIVPLPGLSNPVRLQIIEADRVGNPNLGFDTASLVNGIEKDDYGAPIAYHIMKGHPGNLRYLDSSRWKWDRYEAFNRKTGLRNLIHYYKPERAGQSRGVPFLSPVIEPLKVLSRYTQAELMAAVVSALFTVFVKSPAAQGLNSMPVAPGAPQVVTTGSQNAQAKPDLQLGNGAVVDLAPGEEITFADPKRPNAAFDPFFLAIVRQIGVALGIPFEVLIKHYTASYSAARAAIEDAWQFFMVMRADLADNVCQVIYSVWMAWEVANGYINAPGFFADPLIRAAYLGSMWIGPSKRQIDPEKEVNAAKVRVEEGFTTRAEETAALTGGDWETKHRQRVKEERLRREGGVVETPPAAPAAPKKEQQNPDQPEEAEAA